MGFGEARAVSIVQVFLERMQQQMQLDTGREQGPIFEGKIREEGLAVAKVKDTVNGQRVEAFHININGTFRLIDAIFGLVLFFLLCLRCFLLAFPLRRVLELVLHLAPFLHCLLPLRPQPLEPLAGLQVFCPRRLLFLQQPLPQQLGAFALLLPSIHDLVESLGFRWHGDLRQRPGQDRLRNIRGADLPVDDRLLLLGQLCCLRQGGFRCLLRLLLNLCFALLHDLIALLTLLGLLFLLITLGLLLRRNLLPLLCGLLPQGFGFALALLCLALPLGFGCRLLPLPIQLLLLVSEDEPLHVFSVVRRGLAHEHHRLPLEVRGAKTKQLRLAFAFGQVPLQLGHDEVPLHSGGDRLQHLPSAQVVEQRNSES
mmetsp:Transcript_68491/g.191945  ORF Transcript_68491/g.191945 Transcript_68491/m.191945 type:complete len:370 (+) Transcript_68491:936-2045(+)